MANIWRQADAAARFAVRPVPGWWHGTWVAPAIAERLLRRLPTYIDASGDCWEWLGGRSRKGYGQLGFYDGVSRSHVLAHRFVWDALCGPIDPDMVIDHRCYNTACVNPDHLELTTIKVNNQRARSSFWKVAKQKPQCNRGHAYAEHGRVWIRPDGSTNRYCLQCRRERHARKRAAANV